MKKSFLKKLALILCVGLLACVVAACGKGYTVRFETNGGTEYAVVTTASQEQGVILPTPERAGYEFAGWYTNAACTGQPLRVSTYVPTADVTLYAKWVACEYVVSFETFGGTEYVTVTSNGRDIALPTPQKDGYDFAGWYTNETCTGEALGAIYTPTADVTLYAKWVEESGFEVRFETNGGATLSAIRSEGDAIVLPTPTRYGYEFDGWYGSADFTGTALGATFAPDSDVTLYAKWREVAYLYIYIEDTAEYVRKSFAPGAVVSLATVDGLDTYTIRGAECSLDHYEDMNGNVITSVTMNGNMDIVARYDLARVPAKERVEYLGDGRYECMGNVVKVLHQADTYIGAFAFDVSFYKGASGGVPMAFRITLSGNDYAYEDAGTSYLLAYLSISEGYVETAYVKDMTWTRIKRVSFASLPAAWQEKFNGARAGEWMTANIAIYDFGTSFAMYVDGDYVDTFTHNVLSTITGTGWGFRANSKGAIFSNATYASDIYAVSYQTNGGTAVASGHWALGALDAPATFRDGYAFDGWYYDAGLTRKVDLEYPGIGSDITLYAGWKQSEYDVTLMDGQTEVMTYGYESGEMYLPTLPAKETRIFNGWYVDEACTVAFNPTGFVMTQDITLYAGWRLYTNSSYTKQPDGSYTIGTTNGAMIFGETPYDYTEYSATFKITVGVTKDSLSLAFRMAQTGDNKMEGTYLAWGITISSGELWFGNSYNNTWNGASISVRTALNNAPSAWNNFWTQKITNGTQGDVVSATLSVKDYGTYVECYAEGALVMTYSTLDKLNLFTAKGYGTRISADNVNIMMQAPKKIDAYTVSFYDGDELISKGAYANGQITFPTVGKVNHVVTGWYYDKALTQAVDAQTFTTDKDVSLYAGWRLYTNSSYVKQPDGSYTIGTTNGAMVFGETQYTYAEYSATFKITVGVTKNSLSLAFRMAQTADNAMEGTYLAFGIGPSTGEVWFGNSYNNVWNSSSTGISKTISLANSHFSWKDFWAENVTNGKTGDELSITLTVKDYGTYVECFAEDVLVLVYDDAAKLSMFTAKGYGTRISADNVNVVMHEPKQLTPVEEV